MSKINRDLLDVEKIWLAKPVTLPPTPNKFAKKEDEKNDLVSYGNGFVSKKIFDNLGLRGRLIK